MKVFLFLHFLIIISVTCQSQTIELMTYEDPYKICLKMYVDSLKGMNVLKSGDSVYVFQSEYISNYQGQYDSVFFQMVNQQDIKTKIRDKKAIRLIVINPVQFEQGNSKINVVNFGVNRKNGRYHYINNGFLSITIRFDCKDNKYHYEVEDEH